jgi:hypothetical protein
VFVLTILQGRDSEFAGALYTSDSEAAHLDEDDALTFSIGREGEPLLEISSAEATANGSTIEITNRAAPAAYTLRITTADAAELPLGTLNAELSYTAAGLRKSIEIGILHNLEAT